MNTPKDEELSKVLSVLHLKIDVKKCFDTIMHCYRYDIAFFYMLDSKEIELYEDSECIYYMCYPIYDNHIKLTGMKPTWDRIMNDDHYCENNRIRLYVLLDKTGSDRRDLFIWQNKSPRCVATLPQASSFEELKMKLKLAGKI